MDSLLVVQKLLVEQASLCLLLVSDSNLLVLMPPFCGKLLKGLMRMSRVGKSIYNS